MPPPSAPTPAIPTLHGTNVRRLMAQLNMTQAEVVIATGLDERTVRSILHGATRPHARTLHKLADGLGVSTDELFRNPYQAVMPPVDISSLDAASRDAAPIATVPEATFDRTAFDRAEFDRATNPIAAQAADSHPQLFEGWTPADFNELFSRMAVGGELTEAGTLTVAREMNDRRELMYQVAVVMESHEADLMRDFIKLLFRRVTTIDETYP